MVAFGGRKKPCLGKRRSVETRFGAVKVVGIASVWSAVEDEGYVLSSQVKASHNFEVLLASELSWIIVREYEDGKFFLHSISDRLDIKNLIK